MKFIVFVTLAVIGTTFAQDGESVIALTQWPQNHNTRGGAIVQMVFANLDDGSCVVELPGMVRMFHVMNGHIISGDESNPVEGRYKIAAPAHWEATNGTFNVLIIFDRDEIFNITDIQFKCDPSDKNEISVYSFPQNDLVQEASSNVHYTKGFHKGDVLTITLPAPVARFNFTTMDSEYTVVADGSTVFTLSGFKNAPGIDDMKEVHFSINYEDSAGDGANWFSAADVTVQIQNLGDAE